MSRHHVLFLIAKFNYYTLMKMVVLTRKQLEKLSKEELLINELLTVNSIHEELANITSRFDEFVEKYVRIESELEISKNYTKLLSKQIETLQKMLLALRNTFREK